MKWLEYVRSKPMVRKGLIAGGGAVLVYTLFGFLALPPILKSAFQKPSPKRSTGRRSSATSG